MQESFLSWEEQTGQEAEGHSCWTTCCTGCSSSWSCRAAVSCASSQHVRAAECSLSLHSGCGYREHVNRIRSKIKSIERNLAASRPDPSRPLSNSTSNSALYNTPPHPTLSTEEWKSIRIHLHRISRIIIRQYSASWSLLFSPSVILSYEKKGRLTSTAVIFHKRITVCIKCALQRNPIKMKWNKIDYMVTRIMKERNTVMLNMRENISVTGFMLGVQ